MHAVAAFLIFLLGQAVLADDQLSITGVEKKLVNLLSVVADHKMNVLDLALHAKAMINDLIPVTSSLVRLDGENSTDYKRALRAFELLEQKMDELDIRAESVTSKIEWSLISFDLLTCRQFINDVQDSLIKFLRADEDKREEYKDNFKEVFDAIFEDSFWRLYEVLTEESSKDFENFANVTRVLLKNDRESIVTFYGVFFRLLIRGVGLDSAYTALKSVSGRQNHVELWTERFHPILKIAAAQDHDIRESWVTQYWEIADSFVRRHTFLSNSVLAHQLQSYLFALYGHRLWFVLVYTGEEGVNKRHFFENCGAYALYHRQSRKIVMVTSLPKHNSGPKVNPDTYFAGYKPSKWGFYLPFEEIAKKMFKRIGYSCHQYTFQGVIESKAFPTLAGPSYHIAKAEVQIKRYFATNKKFMVMAIL